LEPIVKLYQGLEKSFFSTLSRKLAGNLLFLFALSTVFLLILYRGLGKIAVVVNNSGLPPETVETIASVQKQVWLESLVVYGLIAVAFIFTFAFLWFLVVRPVRHLRDFFGRMGGKEGDLSEGGLCRAASAGASEVNKDSWIQPLPPIQAILTRTQSS